MIIDKIENLSLYSNIPNCAVEFIKGLSDKTPEGKYNLIDANYANIETYMTKIPENTKFEAHNNYIDIQILLSGRENIYYTDRTKLTENQPYNSEKDIVFYNESVEGADFLTLNGTNFAMIFPHEAHAPQAAINKIPQNVKKVVVKIKA